MANGWIELDKKNSEGPKILKKVINFWAINILIFRFNLLKQGYKYWRWSSADIKKNQLSATHWCTRKVYSRSEKKKTHSWIVIKL